MAMVWCDSTTQCSSQRLTLRPGRKLCVGKILELRLLSFCRTKIIHHAGDLGFLVSLLTFPALVVLCPARGQEQGQSQAERIVGGTPVPLGTYPYFEKVDAPGLQGRRIRCRNHSV